MISILKKTIWKDVNDKHIEMYIELWGSFYKTPLFFEIINFNY
jgi:hypothetical protein